MIEVLGDIPVSGAPVIFKGAPLQRKNLLKNARYFFDGEWIEVPEEVYWVYDDGSYLTLANFDGNDVIVKKGERSAEVIYRIHPKKYFGKPEIMQDSFHVIQEKDRHIITFTLVIEKSSNLNIPSRYEVITVCENTFEQEKRIKGRYIKTTPNFIDINNGLKSTLIYSTHTLEYKNGSMVGECGGKAFFKTYDKLKSWDGKLLEYDFRDLFNSDSTYYKGIDNNRIIIRNLEDIYTDEDTYIEYYSYFIYYVDINRIREIQIPDDLKHMFFIPLGGDYMVMTDRNETSKLVKLHDPLKEYEALLDMDFSDVDPTKPEDLGKVALSIAYQEYSKELYDLPEPRITTL